MKSCIDPAVSAQVRLLKHEPQRGSSCSTPTFPICDHATGVLQGFEPVAVYALVFERSDHALDHAVLLRAARGDEFLLQAISLGQGRAAAAAEHQTVVRPQQEWAFAPAQTTIASDQDLLQRSFGSFGAAASSQVPTQQFAAGSSRSPGPVRTHHHARPTHGTDRWPSAHLAPEPLRARPGCEV